MIAFTLTIHCEPPRAVEVRIYENLRAMRAAASRYDLARNDRAFDASSLLGICHRFQQYTCANGKAEIKPLCAIVRLAKPHIGAGILSHELAHAAVWMRELQFPNDPLVADDDEWLCWVLGELVSCAVGQMQAREIYDS